ncbi:hypothetical protein JXB41_02100 [Candidatus Woesearchaeota archaeon]|nr:hypothetical protein [Candidatus Woesearchaeota archaeon]
MQKRGATVINFVLIFGLLVVGVVVLSSLRSIFFWQSSETEKEIYLDFFEKIKDSIEKSMMFPSDSIYNLSFTDVEEYVVSVDNHELSVFFPEKDLEIKDTVIVSNINVIPSKFRTSGIIYVIKKNRNLFVSNNISCTINNKICEPGCIIQENPDMRCDPDCYNEYSEDSCINYCIDINRDGITNHLDRDDICDKDCYNNLKNGGFYDSDCLESNDNICDPDTHMIKDNYCDKDCLGPAENSANGVCDPDCESFDIDCPEELNKQFLKKQQ